MRSSLLAVVLCCAPGGLLAAAESSDAPENPGIGPAKQPAASVDLDAAPDVGPRSYLYDAVRPAERHPAHFLPSLISVHSTTTFKEAAQPPVCIEPLPWDGSVLPDCLFAPQDRPDWLPASILSEPVSNPGDLLHMILAQ